jgi:hypothetical protein
VKINFHDNTELVGTDFVTVTTALKNAEGNLRAVGQDKSALSKMETQNPRDFLRRPDVVQAPKDEIARIDADLRHALKRLDEAEALIKQRREQLQALLG